MYPCEYMDSFKKFSANKLPDRCKFFSSLKDEIFHRLNKSYFDSVTDLSH